MATLGRIEAVFEDGVFKPLSEVSLPEHQRVFLLLSADDLPAEGLARAAEAGGGLAFLSDRGEDVYSTEDGEPI